MSSLDIDYDDFKLSVFAVSFMVIHLSLVLKAKETYDDAMKQGYGAMLMEEDDFASDIFSCLVGNLPPDTEAFIKFGYVTELSLQPDGVLTFLLPNILNPRYNPSIECKH